MQNSYSPWKVGLGQNFVNLQVTLVMTNVKKSILDRTATEPVRVTIKPTQNSDPPWKVGLGQNFVNLQVTSVWQMWKSQFWTELQDLRPNRTSYDQTNTKFDFLQNGHRRIIALLSKGFRARSPLRVKKTSAASTFPQDWLSFTTEASGGKCGLCNFKAQNDQKKSGHRSKLGRNSPSSQASFTTSLGHTHSITH
jgi:hypothetical protein